MAHESFEDPETAALMNQLFINIKVDREERPDVDDIYMQATLVYTGEHGGWPMTVFLTPEGRPFHGGTYYPPQPRHGMPSFRQIMLAVNDAYRNRRTELENAASQITAALQRVGLIEENLALDTPLDEVLLESAARKLITRADTLHGGLHGGQPKFPSPMNLEFLLRHYATTRKESYLRTVTFTLKKMAQGGIYDQLGGGFHRYSVDNRWLVPHFEKMLYDNAQLARVYLHAYQITGESFYERIAREILDYVKREMLDPCGGFYSAQDADSEGEEGKFFVWSSMEIHEALQEHLSPTLLEALMLFYDITEDGNFEGHNIPNQPFEAQAIAKRYELGLDEFIQAIDQGKQILFARREKRIKPHRDEKMLAAWNGMMLAAFAEAARVLDSVDYRHIAEKNAEFILSILSMPDGRLYRTHKRKSEGQGESKLNGYLEDYACVIEGLLELYQTTFNPRWYKEAKRLTDHVIAHFADGEGKGFYDTSDDHEKLIARPKSQQDNATPSGNSLMALNLIRLAAYSGETKYTDAAQEYLSQIVAGMQEYPSAFGNALIATHLFVYHPIEVAIIGDNHAEDTRALLNIVQKTFRPLVQTALSSNAVGETAEPPLLAQRTQRENKPTVYVCEGFICKRPTTSAAELEQLLM
jgi:hypothetical protein